MKLLNFLKKKKTKLSDIFLRDLSQKLRVKLMFFCIRPFLKLTSLLRNATTFLLLNRQKQITVRNEIRAINTAV